MLFYVSEYDPDRSLMTFYGTFISGISKTYFGFSFPKKVTDL